MAERQGIISTILQHLPPEAQISRVEYEGPRIALYTKKPRFLYENNYIISEIVNAVKKRVVIRTDVGIRKTEEEAKQIILEAIPKEAGLSSIFFDKALGEVVVEVKRPQLLSEEKGFPMIDLVERTGWKIRIRKAPHITSAAIQNIYQTLKSSADERMKFYKESGEVIFRSRLSSEAEVTLYTLGGFNQVGRSAVLVCTRESKILLDCGIHPGAKNPWEAYPRFDWIDLDFDELDAIIISHAHLDHTGFLPAMFKYNYKGPVYCTEPTLDLMVLLHMDYVKLASSEGGSMLYDNKDIREMIKHTITIPYATVTDVTPDVKLVLNNAGHILGSATIHLHIGEGAHNILYTGDYKFGRTMLLDAATWNFPRIETLITESTYGAKEDIMPPREEVELNLINSINRTLKEGGKVLMPVPAVGRAQEIMLVLNQYMSQGTLLEAPIFLEGMISEATAIHVAHPEFLSRELRSKIMEEDTNPFESPYFTVIEHPSARDEVFRQGPAIIMATSGMLEGGPVLEYLQEIAPDERNKIIFVSYQIPGTLGRRILDGAREVSLMADGKIRIVNIKAQVEKIEGFSGHSDYNQIIRYIAKLRPKLKTVVVNHGEKRKVENVANVASRVFKLQALHPDVQEAIKLY